MASIPVNEPKFSPRETRILSSLRKRGWVTSDELTHAEYGTEKGWPLNARKIVTGTLLVIERKLLFHKSDTRLEKTGGGRAGTKYRLAKSKPAD